MKVLLYSYFAWLVGTVHISMQYIYGAQKICL